MPQGKCNNCHHSTRSRTHHIRCAGMTLQQWHASHIGRSVRQSTPRRTAGEIFAVQTIDNYERITAIQSHIEIQESQL